MSELDLPSEFDLPPDVEAIIADRKQDERDRRTLSGKYTPEPGVCRVCSGKVVAEIGFPDDGRIGGRPRAGYIAGWHCADCYLSYCMLPPDPPPKEPTIPMPDDEKLKRQLTRCGINVLPGTPIVGQLGLFTFRFYNYYWIANGPMPLLMARTLYDHPVGSDIRAGGDGPGRHPEVYATTYFDSEGNELFSDPDGSQEQQMKEFIERGTLPENAMAGKRWVPDAKAVYAYAQVLTYHIDTELGLYVFAQHAGQVKVRGG